MENLTLRAGELFQKLQTVAREALRQRGKELESRIGYMKWKGRDIFELSFC